MSRLPPALQPVWPLAKRGHRLLTRGVGSVGRGLAPLAGPRAVPVSATASAAETARREPASVTLHPGPAVAPVRRTAPEGTPPGHWSFLDAAAVDPPDRFVLEVRDGRLVGDLGAVVTPGGLLDAETSEYFGISGWREHPLYLRPRLPALREVDRDLLVLGTRGGGNYYHFLLDVLPRLGVQEQALPGRPRPALLSVPHQLPWQRELLGLLGLGDARLVQPDPRATVRAPTLWVPSLPNPAEVAPRWVVDWLRDRLRPRPPGERPRRLWVTRPGGRRRTRRLEGEDRLWPELERRGFARIDPGTLPVREQVDHFAAAEVVVGLHGAALTNLVFAAPGVRVLHLLAPRYVKHCFWAITDAIPGARYRYLVGRGRPVPPGRPMQGIQDDVVLDPEEVLAELDVLLS